MKELVKTISFFFLKRNCSISVCCSCETAYRDSIQAKKKMKKHNLEVLNFDLRLFYDVCLVRQCKAFIPINSQVSLKMKFREITTEWKSTQFPLNSGYAEYTACLGKVVWALMLAYSTLIRKHRQSRFSKIKNQIHSPLQIALIGKHLAVYLSPMAKEGRHQEGKNWWHAR